MPLSPNPIRDPGGPLACHEGTAICGAYAAGLGQTILLKSTLFIIFSLILSASEERRRLVLKVPMSAKDKPNIELDNIC